MYIIPGLSSKRIFGESKVSNDRNLGAASLLLLIVVLVGGFAVAQSQQTGGIVPTEYHNVKVAPGPEPDVTFFASGDVLGKVEPCG
jgi:hypothetical protein